MKHLGITGTRNGFNKEQLSTFETLINQLKEKYPTLDTFHQGQCIGVDVKAAKILSESFKIISHPPTNQSLVGSSPVDESRPKKGYFARNRDIVNESDIMIVVPAQMQHQNYGGTWYTHDYALEKKKPTYVIYPDGSLCEL